MIEFFRISQKDRIVLVGGRLPFSEPGRLSQVVAFKYLPDDEPRVVFETIPFQNDQFLLWSIITAPQIHDAQFCLRMKLLREGFFFGHAARFSKRIANKHDVRLRNSQRIAKSVLVCAIGQNLDEDLSVPCHSTRGLRAKPSFVRQIIFSGDRNTVKPDVCMRGFPGAIHDKGIAEIQNCNGD